MCDANDVLSNHGKGQSSTIDREGKCVNSFSNYYILFVTYTHTYIHPLAGCGRENKGTKWWRTGVVVVERRFHLYLKMELIWRLARQRDRRTMGIMLFLGASVFQPESVDTHRGDRERESEGKSSFLFGCEEKKDPRPLCCLPFDMSVCVIPFVVPFSCAPYHQDPRMELVKLNRTKKGNLK